MNLFQLLTATLSVLFGIFDFQNPMFDLTTLFKPQQAVSHPMVGDFMKDWMQDIKGKVDNFSRQQEEKKRQEEEKRRNSFIPILNHDEMNDVIAGYIDSLFGLNIRKDLSDCGSFMDRGAEDFKAAFANIVKSCYFFQSLDAKKEYFNTGFNQLMQVTPDIITDLGKCREVGEATDKMNRWNKDHANPIENVKRIKNKLETDPLPILQMVIQALDELTNHAYYDFGESLGDIVWALVDN